MPISSQSAGVVPTAGQRKSRSLKGEVARLEAELQASRAREEVARNALMSMHRELEDAYVRIGRQQEKLRLLVTTLQAERFGVGPRSAHL